MPSLQEIEEAKVWARRRVKKIKLPDFMEEDREQFYIDAEIAVVKAVEDFDSKKSRFATHAYNKVSYAIKDTRRRIDLWPRSVQDKCNADEELRQRLTPISIDTMIGEACIGDIIPDDAASPEEVVTKEQHQVNLVDMMADAIYKLSEEEKRVVVSIYYNNKTLAQTQELLGYNSISKLNTIKENAFKKLRRHLSGEDL
jgi:RNA polymerase sigma factor (sigma-70 family)